VLPISFILQGKKEAYKKAFIERISDVFTYTLWKEGKKFIAPGETSDEFIWNTEADIDDLFTQKISSESSFKNMLKVAGLADIESQLGFVGKAMVHSYL